MEISRALDKNDQVQITSAEHQTRPINVVVKKFNSASFTGGSALNVLFPVCCSVLSNERQWMCGRWILFDFLSYIGL